MVLKLPSLVRFVSSEAPRINPVGIQYLSKYIDNTLFPTKTNEDLDIHKQNLTDISKKYLETHKLLGKPTNIQEPLSFKIPGLTAPTLDKHFRRLALYASEPYKEHALDLANAKLPKMPKKFELKSGWLKYDKNGKNPVSVEYPDENALVFDVETLYKVSDYPVMAVACSSESWYAWCSPILTSESNSFEHLVPLNTNNKEQVIVGHNVGYDRARIQEEYDLTATKAFFLDTMSLHIAVSGMCSQQRIKWLARKKAQKIKLKADADFEADNELDSIDNGQEIRQLEIDDPWLNYSSPNSLADLANFYFNEQVDKDIRNSFAADDISYIKDDFQNLIQYCANDVAVTHRIYSKVLPEFLETCPHPVSFSALRFMGSGILPTNEKWNEYLENADSLYLKSRKRVDDRLIEMAENALSMKDKPEEFNIDPWLSQLDWTITPIRIKKDGTPHKNQRLPGYPNWYKDLYSTKEKKLSITTRTRITPILLKLKCEGYPVYWNENFGWCFKADKSDYEKLVSLTYQAIPELTYPEAETPVNINSNRLPDFVHFKVKNPASSETKSTQLLSKANSRAFETGVLKSDDPFAQEALELNSTCSYWISARDRIKSQFVVSKNQSNGKPLGLIIPQVITMGTITRRAVEKTWLTASNAKSNRIGSELKSKIQAPETHCFVGADVDSEELWIASLLGDAITSQHGGTAIGWMTLEGAKKDGTDLHSKTSNILGIDRNQAKIFNYGRIYGAGVKYAATLLKNFNSELTEKQCQERAKVLYAETKGQTITISLNGEKKKIWYGGSESVLFNELERIANLEKPQTPVLKAGITRALMKKNLNMNSFLPSRINWAIQSSGVDYLHLLCVSMNYFITKYDINARLSLSVHDEIRYLCEKKDKYRVAMALQISNLWTRAMFAESVGLLDLPQSCAFFSAVDVDHILRKEVDMDCVTPSNPIPELPGESVDINELLAKGEEALLGEGKDIKLPELDSIDQKAEMDAVNPEDPEFKYSYENPKWTETSLMMQISQDKKDVQRLLKEYKNNYGRLDFIDVLSGELVTKPKQKKGIRTSTKIKSAKEDKPQKATKSDIQGSKEPTKKTTRSSSKAKAKPKTTSKSSKTKKSSVPSSEPSTSQTNSTTEQFNINYLSIDEIANIRDTSSFSNFNKDNDIWTGIFTNEDEFIDSLNPDKEKDYSLDNL